MKFLNLPFFQFYCKINRNQSGIVVKGTYGLHPHQYFEILNLKFGGISLVTRRFVFHSNSQDANESKHLPISIDFRIQKHGAVTPVQYYISMIIFPVIDSGFDQLLLVYWEVSFRTNFLHCKSKETRLLSTESECNSCFTSCQTT